MKLNKYYRESSKDVSNKPKIKRKSIKVFGQKYVTIVLESKSNNTKIKRFIGSSNYIK